MNVRMGSLSPLGVDLANHMPNIHLGHKPCSSRLASGWGGHILRQLRRDGVVVGAHWRIQLQGLGRGLRECALLSPQRFGPSV